MFSLCPLEKCVMGLNHGYYLTAFAPASSPFKSVKQLICGDCQRQSGVTAVFYEN